MPSQRDHKRPVLTRAQLLALEDELIIEYQKEEFQQTLHQLWNSAGENEFERVKARQEACLPIQLPVIERYGFELGMPPPAAGFEPSTHGLARSLYAYNAPTLDPAKPENRDFQDRAQILQWLVDPVMQAFLPKPRVPTPLYSAMPGLADQNEAGLGGSRLEVVARQLSGEVSARVTLFPRDTVVRIREAVEAGFKYPRPYKLVFDGKVLQDSQTAEGAGLVHGAEISVVNLPPLQVLTASGDKTARLYDAMSGRPLQVFSGHQATVRSAAFSPDGFLMVTASRDRTAKVFSVASGECLATLSGHSKYLNMATFGLDNKSVITASDDCSVKFFDVESSKCEWTFHVADACVNSVTCSADFKLLLALGDNSAKMLNLGTGVCEQVFHGHRSYLNSAVFSPDRLRVATASDDRLAKLFDAASGHCEFTFGGHQRAVNSAEFSPDGKLLVTASDDRYVLVFEATWGTLVHRLQHEQSVNSATFSPDGRLILTASDDHLGQLFHAVSGAKVLTLTGHTGAVYRAVFQAEFC